MIYTGKLQNKTNKLRRLPGFTLIELLVVIVIAAILFTYATLAIRGHNPEDRIHTEARRLNQLIQLALEQAILRGNDYALEVHINGYRFLRQQQGKWVKITNDRLLRQRQLPENMQLELNLEDTTVVIDPAANMDETFSLDSQMSKDNSDRTSSNASNTRNKARPQIYLLSSGEITPEFSIRLSCPDVETSYLVEGKFDGQIKNRISDN